jgi:hypothetical protein
MNKQEEKKLKIYAGEIFKEIVLEDKLRMRYAISNYGRLVSFAENIEEGRILKGSVTEGYRLFRYKLFKRKKILNKHKFICRLVAEYFLEKKSEEQTQVLHLDHNLSNDFATNLKWATKEEMYQHHRTSPKVKLAKVVSTKRIVEYNRKREGAKLTTTQVMLIKKILENPNRKTRMKIIAKRFGISEMQLYRIKSGENWARVKI